MSLGTRQQLNKSFEELNFVQNLVPPLPTYLPTSQSFCTDKYREDCEALSVVIEAKEVCCVFLFFGFFLLLNLQL